MKTATGFIFVVLRRRLHRQADLMRFSLLLCLAIVNGISAAEAATSGALPEVTVMADRLKLQQQVSNFVYGITALENDEGVARWQTPVCPSVTGVPHEQGQFIIERISDIARDAGVPLARPHCHPNLIIFVTAHPRELLQVMENRYFAVVFGNAPASEADEFVNAARPVRVWHGSYITQPGGIPLSAGVPTLTLVSGGNRLQVPTYHLSGNPSRLVNMVVWTIGSMYVVADKTRMPGVSLGQFSDYLGMVSFAEIKTTPHFGDAKTILKLFDGPAQNAPVGMSDWDRAYLKALYGTMHESKLQRSLMTTSMVRDLVPTATQRSAE